ncbi:MAG TPA: hypothetical protein VJX10_13825 [Pseudonocardiaceae bacterium]|nr:hypothetical protein [Pseudonocardiaceae bacterium]
MMGFLLLGVDSLIAGVAISPMLSRRMLVPLALLFGVGDAAGFLVGTALHWSISASLGAVLQTSILVALGAYWIATAVLSKQAALASGWGGWLLPLALTIDNITFGLVDGVPAHASVWSSAGEQALSSVLMAGIGLAVGIGVTAAVPALRHRTALAKGISGAAVIAAAGILLAVG